MKTLQFHEMEQTTTSLPPFWPPSPPSHRVFPLPMNEDIQPVTPGVQCEELGMKPTQSYEMKHTKTSLPPFWPRAPPPYQVSPPVNEVVMAAEYREQEEEKTVKEEVVEEKEEVVEEKEEEEEENEEEEGDSEEDVEGEESEESEEVPRELAGFVQHVEMQMDQSEENEQNEENEENSGFSETSSTSSESERGRRRSRYGYHAEGISATIPRRSSADIPYRNHSDNMRARSKSCRAFSGELKSVRQIPAVPATRAGDLAVGEGVTLSQQKVDALKYLRMLDAGGLAAVQQVNREVAGGRGSERRAQSGPLTWRGTPENPRSNVAGASTQEQACMCASRSGQVATKCHQHPMPAKLVSGPMSRATEESRSFGNSRSWSSVQIGSDRMGSDRMGSDRTGSDRMGREGESWAQIRARQRSESAERRESWEGSEGEGVLSSALRRASLSQPVEVNSRHRPPTCWSPGFKDPWDNSPLAALTSNQLHSSPSSIRSRGRSLTISKSERNLRWMDMDAGEVVSQRSGLLSPSMELRTREASPNRYLSQPTSPSQVGGLRSMSMGVSRPASPSLRSPSAAPQLSAFQRQHSRKTAASSAGLISPEPTLSTPILRTPPHHLSPDYYSSASRPKAPVFDTRGLSSEEMLPPLHPTSPAGRTVVVGIPVAMMGQPALRNLAMTLGHPVANAALPWGGLVTSGGEGRIDHPTSTASVEEIEEKKMVFQTASAARSGVGKGLERGSRGSGKTRGGKQRRGSRAKVVMKAAKPFELTAWVQKLLDEAMKGGPAPTPSMEEATGREPGVHVTESERNAAITQMAEVEEVAEIHPGGVKEVAEMGMEVKERDVIKADDFSFACSGGVPALLVQPPVEDEEEEKEVEEMEAKEEVEEEAGKVHGEVETDAAPPLAEPDLVESEEEGSRRGVGVEDEGNEAGLPKGVSAEEGLAHSLAFLANLNGGGLGMGGGLGFGLPPKPRSPPSEPHEVIVRDGSVEGEETEAEMETETKGEGVPEKDLVRPLTVTMASQTNQQMAMIHEGAQEEVCVKKVHVVCQTPPSWMLSAHEEKVADVVGV